MVPLPFDFVVAGRAVSQRAKSSASRERWRLQIRAAAEAHWGDADPEAGPLSVTVSYLSIDPGVDVDNIPKPILDALKGLVFADDEQVIDLQCRKRRLMSDLEIVNPPVQLLEYIADRQHVLHVVVVRATDSEVTF